MPTISLRLTDEQHRALKEWAHGSMRSIQREAVFRIFDERQVSGAADVVASRPDSPAQRSGARVSAPDDPHFKPDFK